MKPDFPTIEKAETTSLHSREVEYALILSQMVRVAEEDPSQMRLAIYEFARAKLKSNTAWTDDEERRRLSAALEAAILGVEKFAVSQDDKRRLLEASTTQSDQLALPHGRQTPSLLTERAAGSAWTDKPGRRWPAPRIESWPIAAAQQWALISRLARFSIGALLVGVIVCVVIYAQRTSTDSATGKSAATTSQSQPMSDVTPAVADRANGVSASSGLPFALPSDYGVYAQINTTLAELQALPEQVPDKRIAMSTPIHQPSRTELPDGKARFVVFRRDFAGNAPDRVDVRVIAQVVRALTFDPKGKPNFATVSDAWIIRNASYEFKVRPIAGNSEMLLVQSRDSDLELPAGRYVLALKDKGYEFSVAGVVTDPLQCLERTDAANGSFYSDCQKSLDVPLDRGSQR